MEQKLESLLLGRYPLLFGRISYFGCADGWFDIINDAACQLEPLIEDFIDSNHSLEFPMAIQVKEKFGELRFYMSPGYTDEMQKIVKNLELMSTETCERCGKNGKLVSDGWIRTLCDGCVSEYAKGFNDGFGFRVRNFKPTE